MSKIHRRRPLGYRFALGALDAAERLRQIGSREAVRQMVYDQLRILGATQRTTSQLTNANGQAERQMSRSHHPVEKAMALIPVRDARQSCQPFDAVFSPFKHGSIRYGRTASAADRAVLVELRQFLAVIGAFRIPSTLWGHASRVPGRGWRGAVPPLTPQRQRHIMGAGRDATCGCRSAPARWSAPRGTPRHAPQG